MSIQKYTVYGEELSLDVSDQSSLQCTTGGSNKFWQAVHGRDTAPKTPADTKSPYVVVVCWGKLGTAGQKQYKRFRSESLAQQYLRGRVRDKELKGYVPSTGMPNTTVGVIKAQTSIPYVETEWDLL